ncbi:transposase [Candidatus Dojkabacteria bacterium]|uniref:Transposase n=1 Tax=Candidatus Dojkabacteria bacterium TaxID=2099670 RepID=A0A955KVU1_9BACT|nr:transposase [Candidatus Dojkabacteria bacterium]
MDLRNWEQAKSKTNHYKRRRPEETELYRLVFHNHDRLEQEWELRFQSTYGYLREEVNETLQSYLDCGLIVNGAARIECQNKDCAHSTLLAFSCKKRGLCPSCAGKRAVIFAEHLNSNILKPLSYRHMVFSIPKILRPYFKFNRKHLDLLFKASWDTIRNMFNEILPDGNPGAILALHTAGDSLNFNPHIHGLVTNGVLGENSIFYPLPDFKSSKFTEYFAHRLLTLMKRAELVPDSRIELIESWQHSGFSVWAGEPIDYSEQESILFISRYIDKGPVANSKISIDGDIITYETKDGKTHEFYPLEFLARITPHIPNKWESTTRYYGLYSHRKRGKEKRVNESLGIRIEELPLEAQRQVSKSWAALIKKVYEVDPLICPRCGEKMKIRELLKESREIEKVAEHFSIPTFARPPPLLDPTDLFPIQAA